MSQSFLRWSSVVVISVLSVACDDTVTPAGAADAGPADTGSASDTGGSVDVGRVDVGAIDVPGDVGFDAPGDRGGDAGSSCAGATEGAACTTDGQTCGGPCSDPCQFCNLYRCTGGRWDRLEVFPMPCVDSGAADAGRADGGGSSGARMLWQAPGGFAGTGPAVMVDADGTVRVWDNARSVALASPADPTRTLHVTSAQASDLFARWAAVDRTGLPHSGGSADCYGVASYRPCDGIDCRVETVMFQTAAQLAPEMDPVRGWFDEVLTDRPTSAYPNGYCRF
ncbi:MAG: hypothetical protein JWM10_4006 [Myxococcaceae bacterium]|nr:hypothetical protein [Myxococcaceae bacterium]